MNKVFIRFVAFLLAPCLIADPVCAAGWTSTTRPSLQAFFQSQAIVAPIRHDGPGGPGALATVLQNQAESALAVGPILRSLGLSPGQPGRRGLIATVITSRVVAGSMLVGLGGLDARVLAQSSSVIINDKGQPEPTFFILDSNGKMVPNPDKLKELGITQTTSNVHSIVLKKVLNATANIWKGSITAEDVFAGSPATVSVMITPPANKIINTAFIQLAGKEMRVTRVDDGTLRVEGPLTAYMIKSPPDPDGKIVVNLNTRWFSGNTESISVNTGVLRAKISVDITKIETAPGEKRTNNDKGGALKYLSMRDDADAVNLEELKLREHVFERLAQLPTATTKRVDNVEVNVVLASLPEGIHAYQFRTADNTLIAVMSSSFHQEEALYHEVREDYWIDRGYTRHEAHVLASTDQIIKYSHGGTILTPYHAWQIDFKLRLSQIALLLDEDRTWHHELIQEAGLDLDTIKKYEDRVRRNLESKRDKLALVEMTAPFRFLERSLFSSPQVFKISSDQLAEDRQVELATAIEKAMRNILSGVIVVVTAGAALLFPGLQARVLAQSSSLIINDNRQPEPTFFILDSNGKIVVNPEKLKQLGLQSPDSETRLIAPGPGETVEKTVKGRSNHQSRVQGPFKLKPDMRLRIPVNSDVGTRVRVQFLPKGFKKDWQINKVGMIKSTSEVRDDGQGNRFIEFTIPSNMGMNLDSFYISDLANTAWIIVHSGEVDSNGGNLHQSADAHADIEKVEEVIKPKAPTIVIDEPGRILPPLFITDSKGRQVPNLKVMLDEVAATYEDRTVDPERREMYRETAVEFAVSLLEKDITALDGWQPKSGLWDYIDGYLMNEKKKVWQSLQDHRAKFTGQPYKESTRFERDVNAFLEFASTYEYLMDRHADPKRVEMYRSTVFDQALALLKQQIAALDGWHPSAAVSKDFLDYLQRRNKKLWNEFENHLKDVKNKKVSEIIERASQPRNVVDLILEGLRIQDSVSAQAQNQNTARADSVTKAAVTPSLQFVANNMAAFSVLAIVVGILVLGYAIVPHFTPFGRMISRELYRTKRGQLRSVYPMSKPQIIVGIILMLLGIFGIIESEWMQNKNPPAVGSQPKIDYRPALSAAA